MGATELVQAWEAQGRRITVDGHSIWMADLPAETAAAAETAGSGGPGAHGDPILVLHGFPTCSFDWRAVIATLRRHRRVVVLDYPGFGLSDKPDLRYSIRLWADAAAAVVAETGLSRLALLSHDIGNTVGGELLARDLDGDLAFEVTARVLTNGSIYIGMAQLTDGQQLLLDADDARFDLAALGIDPGEAFTTGVAGTFSPNHQPTAEELDAQWLLMSRLDGHTLLPRTIRYIEDRRAEEERFTGAIETHPSPLGIIWGDADPVAVYPMTDRLLEARPDARRITLEGVGHYPMVEVPDRFAAGVLELLG